jgi:hypothetical protein
MPCAHVTNMPNALKLPLVPCEKETTHQACPCIERIKRATASAENAIVQQARRQRDRGIRRVEAGRRADRRVPCHEQGLNADGRRPRDVGQDRLRLRRRVNADTPSVEVIMLPEQDDHINPAGVKGIGELGNVGTNAAVCNAIFHAIGQRLRKLPVRLEQLDV